MIQAFEGPKQTVDFELSIVGQVDRVETLEEILQETQKKILFCTGQIALDNNVLEPWVIAASCVVAVGGLRMADRHINIEVANILGEILEKIFAMCGCVSE